MEDDVPFSRVLELLEKHGYQLLRRRTDPSRPDAGLAVFGRPGSPRISIEVIGRRVGYEYYKTLYDALEGD